MRGKGVFCRNAFGSNVEEYDSRTIVKEFEYIQKRRIFARLVRSDFYRVVIVIQKL